MRKSPELLGNITTEGITFQIFTFKVFFRSENVVDVVDAASRLESSGETGKINISADTYHLVKDFFQCEHCSQIEAKNKGRMICII